MKKLVIQFFEDLNMIINLLYFQILEAIKSDPDAFGCTYSLDIEFDKTKFVNNICRLEESLEVAMKLLDLCHMQNDNFKNLVEELYDSEDAENAKLYSGEYLKELLVSLSSIKCNNNSILETVLIYKSNASLEELVREWKLNVAKLYAIIDSLITYLNIDSNTYRSIGQIQKSDIQKKYSDLNEYRLIHWMYVEDIFNG